MKKALFILAGFSLILLGIGCETNKTRIAEGSVIGGVLGAAGGGLISGSAEGAGIGLLAGTATGALIGSQIDKEPKQTQAAATASASSTSQMTLDQVMDMVKQGVSDEVIINKIKSTKSKFSLTPAQITNLKQQGASQLVIDVLNS